MEPEGELNDVGDIVAARALAALIHERIHIAARREEPLFQMVGADDAETGGIDRLAVALHRREKPGDAGAIDLLDAKEVRQRLARTTDFSEDSALDRGAGESAKLGNELTHRAVLAEVAVSRHMGGEIALQPGFVIPMGAGRIARSPLLPVGPGRRDVDELLAKEDPAQAQMRIEPAVGLDQL